MKNSVKLYSAALPLWFIFFSPTNWLFLLLTQLIIVSFVLYAGLKYINYPDPSQVWRKSIIWNTLYGFVSYLLICFLFLLTHFVSEGNAVGDWIIQHIVMPLDTNPFSSIVSILYVILCLFICGVLVYFANKLFAFRSAKLNDIEKHKLSLCLAIFSAPYLALIPSIVLYQ